MNIKQILKHQIKKDGLFISLYLPIDYRWSRKDFLSNIRSHLHDLQEASDNLPAGKEKYLAALVNKINKYLETVPTQGMKSLAIFSGEDLFLPIKLNTPVPFQAHIGNTLDLIPLKEAEASDPPYLLAIIDRTQAKILLVNHSQTEKESVMIKSDVPQRILAKGGHMGREDKILRHIEDHLHRHLKKVAQQIISLEKSYHTGLLVVGAQIELVGRIQDLLPTSMKKNLIGHFGANIDDKEVLIIEKAEVIVQKYLRSLGK